ncbi:MAG: thiamine phosphate synthase [Acidobacteria bacterium]|nr:thiamine phosphate synthase [Acidobacteriota bacterium]
MVSVLPRFYPILDTLALTRRGRQPVLFSEALLEAGVRLLQFRHKGHFSRQMFETAQTVAGLCAQAGAQLIINDRADLAALLHVGLHLGQDDLPPALALRILGPGAPLGFSTHNAAQLAAAHHEPASYLAIGPVFSTFSKDNPDPQVGLEQIPHLRTLTTKPLVAIGGITRETAQSVLRAGADSIAVIGDIIPDEITRASVRARAAEWLDATR